MDYCPGDAKSAPTSLFCHISASHTLVEILCVCRVHTLWIYVLFWMFLSVIAPDSGLGTGSLGALVLSEWTWHILFMDSQDNMTYELKTEGTPSAMETESWNTILSMSVGQMLSWINTKCVIALKTHLTPYVSAYSAQALLLSTLGPYTPLFWSIMALMTYISFPQMTS